MRILHLSDLHETHDGTTLPELWERAQRVVRGHKYDFVVITGDLTQRAQGDEYDRLRAFLEAEIEPLIASDEPVVKPRVIIVPGNHDVDWDAKDAYESVALSNCSSTEIEKLMETALWRPEIGDYRLKLGPLGHVGVFRVRRESYALRFAAVDKFFRDYYGDSLSEPHRRFQLLQPNGDWAIHLFHRERVAFLAFNSCYQNDRYWHGAQINESAIRFARRYLDNLDPNSELLRIAVWHHGLESHRSRPDRLTLSNLAGLVGTGARIGFHGHVHKANAQIHRFLVDDFALVSTGSLGAGSPDRPDAVGNQLSIVEVHPNRLRIHVYESKDKATYEETEKRHMYFDMERPVDTSLPMRSVAGHVIRRVELNPENGTATFKITVQDLHLQEPIVLARFDRSLTSSPDEKAEVDGQLLEVKPHDLGDVCEYRFAGRPKHYRQLTWSYKIANTFALSRTELAMLPPRSRTHPHLKNHHEAWAHVVQFDYDRLTMTFHVDGTSPYQSSGAGIACEPVVERRAPAPGSWDRDVRRLRGQSERRPLQIITELDKVYDEDRVRAVTDPASLAGQGRERAGRLHRRLLRERREPDRLERDPVEPAIEHGRREPTRGQRGALGLRRTRRPSRRRGPCPDPSSGSTTLRSSHGRRRARQG